MKLITEDSLSYYAKWSAEDNEWVAICPSYPSLSFLDPSPAAALEGIKEVVRLVREDLANE